MIPIADKEIYKLNIKIGADDSEAKSKLSSIEKTVDSVEKKAKKVNKIKASATVTAKDSASSKIDKVQQKVDKIKKVKASTTVTVKDNASQVLEKITKKGETFKSGKYTTTVTAKDEASKTTEKIKDSAEKLKNTKAQIKVTAKDEATKIIENVKGKFSDLVKAGAKKVISLGVAGTVAAGGMGIGTSVKTFMDFESGMKTVQATSQATDAELEKLTATAKELGANTAFSAVQSSEAMNYLAMAGFKTNDIISSMPGLLDGAAASGADLGTVADIVSDGLGAFHMKASETAHFTDVLAQTSASANTSFEMMGETLKYVGSTAGAAGYSIEDVSVVAGLMGNEFVKSGQAGTTLKNAIANMVSPTDSMEAVMKKYNLSLKNSDGSMKSLAQVTDMLRSNMGGLDKAEQMAAASTLFGKEAMAGMLTVINTSEESYRSLQNAVYGADGASKKMADTKLDSLSGQWTILKSAVEGAQIELGERLAPYAKQFVTWITGKMPDITNKIIEVVDYLSKNTDTIKKFAIAGAGIATAFSAFSGASKIVNTISGIQKAFDATTPIVSKAAISTEAVSGGISKLGILGKVIPAIFSPVGLAIAGAAVLGGAAWMANSSIMAKSASSTTDEMNLLERGMNALNGGIFKSKAEMQDLGLIYKDFGSTVSDTFKNKVKESTKSINEFQMFLNKTTLDHVLSGDEAGKLQSMVSSACDSAISTINSKKSDVQNSLSELFTSDGTSMTEAEQATLEYLNKDYDNQVNKANELKEAINQIKQSAVDESRELNQQEIQDVQDKYNQIKQIELEALGSNQEEIAYAKNEFSERIKGIDIKDASELLQEKAKARDDEIVQTKAKYNTEIDMLKSKLSEASAEEQANIQSSIESLEKSRDEKVKVQTDLWDSYVNTIKEKNPEVLKSINEMTGQEMTGQDLKNRQKLENMKSHYEDLNTITQDGMYNIMNTETGVYESVYATVDSTTGQITGMWSAVTQESAGYTSEYKNQIQQIGTETGNTYSQLSMLANGSISASGQIISSMGGVVGELENVTTAADGTTTGILNLNGTPIEITHNADGVITKVQDLNSNIQAVPTHHETVFDFIARGWEKVKEAFASLGGGGVSASVGEEVVGAHADGTDSASAGLNLVGEEGFEIIGGPQLRKFRGGETVLNNSESKAFLNGANQTQKGTFQLAQPQGSPINQNSLSFGDIKVDLSGNNGDVEEMIQEAMLQFGQQLRDAILNIG